ncbi:hypothetical protein QJS66_09950 [Kocuria rhizophila]|nr:hypothetical protein QJS66_09950 [Kocuria rhizophila]
MTTTTTNRAPGHLPRFPWASRPADAATSLLPHRACRPRCRRSLKEHSPSRSPLTRGRDHRVPAASESTIVQIVDRSRRGRTAAAPAGHVHHAHGRGEETGGQEGAYHLAMGARPLRRTMQARRSRTSSRSGSVGLPPPADRSPARRGRG